MKKPSEEDLIMHFYGEKPETLEALRDPEVRARYDEIARLLDSVPHPAVPERPVTYGAEVWAKLAPRLDAPGSGSLAPRHQGEGRREGLLLGRLWAFLTGGAPRWALAGAAAALLVTVGFLAGRFGAPPSPAPAEGTQGLSAEARQRILTGTVAAHLEGSERLLLERVNRPAAAEIDLEGEREWAEALLTTNRLYRRAAREAGQRRVAALLDELEPILLDLAHEGGEPTPATLEETLFKLRVVSGRLEGAGKAVPPRSTHPRTST